MALIGGGERLAVRGVRKWLTFVPHRQRSRSVSVSACVRVCVSVRVCVNVCVSHTDDVIDQG